MSGRENPVWNDFTDFVHHPNAPFKEEFERLARIKGWDRRTKRQNLITLLRTEVEFYWSSNDVDKLECYQYLCREMGIEQIPCTVTQARKVSIPTCNYYRCRLLTMKRRFAHSRSTSTVSLTTCAIKRPGLSHIRLCASFV